METSMKHKFELPILAVILALACPPIVQAQQSNSATFDGHSVEDIDQLQDMSEKGDAATQHELAEEVETAIEPLALAVQKNLIEDTDDLVSKPHNYQGRQLVVIGSVVRFFWEYRLKSETRQNKIVIDVDGLNQADRAELDAAIKRAGFFGRVRARIHGRIERQTSATFELAATELVLIESTDPTEMLVPTRSPLRRRESDDREVASSNGGTAGGGNSGGGNSGGGNSGGGNSGAGNSGAGNSGGGNSGAGNSGNGRGKSKGKGNK
jgi:PPE-repeat protein